MNLNMLLGESFTEMNEGKNVGSNIFYSNMNTQEN
jgi:hypothetical protein